MRRITFRLLLALGLLGTLLPATSAAARTSLLDEVAETVAASSSTNMAHVVNLPHKRRTSSGSLTKAATLYVCVVLFAAIAAIGVWRRFRSQDWFILKASLQLVFGVAPIVGTISTRSG